MCHSVDKEEEGEGVYFGIHHQCIAHDFDIFYDFIHSYT